MERLGRLYINEIVKLHGVPISIETEILGSLLDSRVVFREP